LRYATAFSPGYVDTADDLNETALLAGSRAFHVMRKLLGTLSLIVFGIVLALGLADVGIRIANHWFPYFYRSDPYRGWGLNPGARGWYRREGFSYLRINHDGFRGPDYPRHKPPGVVRVAVLGDSYVEAMQVAEDKTFTAVIGRVLADCPALKGARVEAMNFGVDGYGTAQELIVLQRKVWAYAPDIVVLAIFLGNDIRNNSAALEPDRCRPFYTYDHDVLKLSGPWIDSPGFRLWCTARFDYRDLRLASMFHDTLEAVSQGRRAPTPAHPVEPAINYSIYKPPTDAAWTAAWRVTEGLITAASRDARQHGAMFLSVTEDTGVQVWPVPAVRERFAHHLGVADLFYPDRRIEDLGARNGFAVLALAPALQAYAQSHNEFLHGFKNTPMGFGHWNETGHAQAGRLIAQRLCAMIATGGLAHATPPAR
jgi:hypothetical protein